MATTDQLNIDPNTINGYGIITVDLSNDYIDSENIQYVDLNTDYFIYNCNYGSGTKNCYFVSNYVIKIDGIDKISGPYKTSYDADVAKEEILITEPTIYNNCYLKYDSNSNKVIKKTLTTDVEFDFFAPFVYIV